MGGSQQGAEDAITDINVTPLVDVCLVLVIIFMAIAPFGVQMGINVLQSKTGQKVGKTKASENVNLKLTKDGKLTVNAREVDFVTIFPILQVAIAKSKGKGFQGVMKRHGFHGGPRTHGQSDRARAPGSIGGGTTPGKVFKGMKMPGHMGNRRITVKCLEVVSVDLDRNLILLKGGVPGAPNGLLQLRRSRKSAPGR